MLSLYTMVTFIEYYLKDKTGVPNFVAATLLVAGMALMGSLLSALLAGYVSDRVGRKRIVSAATIAMALAFLAFIFSPSWNMILVIGALFGLGYGAYTSVDWALALDVLPDRNSMARDLGIWGFAVSLPQTLAPMPSFQPCAAIPTRPPTYTPSIASLFENWFGALRCRSSRRG